MSEGMSTEGMSTERMSIEMIQKLSDLLSRIDTIAPVSGIFDEKCCEESGLSEMYFTMTLSNADLLFTKLRKLILVSKYRYINVDGVLVKKPVVVEKTNGPEYELYAMFLNNRSKLFDYSVYNNDAQTYNELPRIFIKFAIDHKNIDKVCTAWDNVYMDKIIKRLAQIDAKKIELDMESHGLYAELTNLRKYVVNHTHD